MKGGPLFTVDMPKGANVEASWGTDKKILLKAQTGSQSDGLVTVRHTLTPAADIKISGFGLSATFTYDANKLLNLLPGARTTRRPSRRSHPGASPPSRRS